MVDLILTVSNPNISEDRLHMITQGICRDIKSEARIKCKLYKPPELSESVGDIVTKGDRINVGQILISLISSGAVVALINVLEVKVQREPSFSYKLHKKENGELVLEFEGENMREEDIEKGREMLDRMFNNVVEEN